MSLAFPEKHYGIFSYIKLLRLSKTGTAARPTTYRTCSDGKTTQIGGERCERRGLDGAGQFD